MKVFFFTMQISVTIYSIAHWEKVINAKWNKNKNEIAIDIFSRSWVKMSIYYLSVKIWGEMIFSVIIFHFCFLSRQANIEKNKLSEIWFAHGIRLVRGTETLTASISDHPWRFSFFPYTKLIANFVLRFKMYRLFLR